MGVCADAFAVDLPRLNDLLDQRLGDVLFYLSHSGTQGDQHWCVYSKEPESPLDELYTVFVIHPGVGIYHTTSAQPTERLEETQIETIPILNRSAREFYSNSSSYQFELLLQGVSKCADAGFVTNLIDGGRPWWLGSILQSASKALNRRDQAELKLLIRKVLRDGNPGYEIQLDDPGFDAEGLGLQVHDDVDHRFGRWNETESISAAKLLTRLLSAKPTFIRPPGRIGNDLDDKEWHDWVHENVAALASVLDLDYRERNVLTFIG